MAEMIICDNGCGVETNRGGYRDQFGGWYLLSDPSGAASDRHFCSMKCLAEWCRKILEANRESC